MNIIKNIIRIMNYKYYTIRYSKTFLIVILITSLLSVIYNQLYPVVAGFTLAMIILLLLGEKNG
jgi:hypothetical protein